MILDSCRLGLGTWNATGEECARAVERALAIGYRHVDTARLYDNERAVGRGLARADVPASEVVVATKVAPKKLGYDDVVASARASRERLGVERIDLLYVHWPRAAYDPGETLAAFDALVDDGVVGAVGVSNFTPDLLDDALARSNHVDAHQVEMHPLFAQERLVAHASEHDYTPVAYSPLARGEALGVPAVRAVAERRDATPAQVCLAWLREKGAVPIPKATGEHVRENYRALGLDLDEADVARIDGIERETRLVDPPGAPWNR